MERYFLVSFLWFFFFYLISFWCIFLVYLVPHLFFTLLYMCPLIFTYLHTHKYTEGGRRVKNIGMYARFECKKATIPSSNKDARLDIVNLQNEWGWTSNENFQKTCTSQIRILFCAHTTFDGYRVGKCSENTDSPPYRICLKSELLTTNVIPQIGLWRADGRGIIYTWNILKGLMPSLPWRYSVLEQNNILWNAEMPELQ